MTTIIVSRFLLNLQATNQSVVDSADDFSLPELHFSRVIGSIGSTISHVTDFDQDLEELNQSDV